MSENHGEPIVDRDFGWSHHNNSDVEQVGRALGGGVQQAIDLAGALLTPAAKAELARNAKKAVYGPRTQQVRRRLDGNWKGWIDKGDLDPGIFLTEGGARLEKLPSGELQRFVRPVRARQAMPALRPASHYRSEVLPGAQRDRRALRASRLH